MTHSGNSWRERWTRESELLAKWQAVAYRLVGMGVAIDDRLDWCLAALVGRDAAAVHALYSSITPTLNADKKLKQLRELTIYDPAAGPLLDAAATVVRIRNSLAHSSIVETRPTWARFESNYRGRQQEVRLWDVEAWLLVRGHQQLLSGLWGVAIRNLDAESAAAILGYVDEELDDDS